MLVGAGEVNWWLRFLCRPDKTCLWGMAERYTLMLPCDMLLVAIDVVNSRRVSSVAGTGDSCDFAQKLVNLLHPAEYVFLVAGERPRVMKCSA